MLLKLAHSVGPLLPASHQISFTHLLGDANNLHSVALPDRGVGANVHQLIHLLHRLNCRDLGWKRDASPSARFQEMNFDFILHFWKDFLKLFISLVCPPLRDVSTWHLNYLDFGGKSNVFFASTLG